MQARELLGARAADPVPKLHQSGAILRFGKTRSKRAVRSVLRLEHVEDALDLGAVVSVELKPVAFELDGRFAASVALGVRLDDLDDGGDHAGRAEGRDQRGGIELLVGASPGAMTVA